jgi:hypothetical protein
VLGQPDHDQAQGDAVRAVLEGEQIAGAACRTGWVGYTLGAHSGGGLVGSGVLWKASATREATFCNATNPSRGYEQNLLSPAQPADGELSAIYSGIAAATSCAEARTVRLPNKAQPDILSSVMTRLVGGSFTRCKRLWLSGWPLPQSWSW